MEPSAATLREQDGLQIVRVVHPEETYDFLYEYLPDSIALTHWTETHTERFWVSTPVDVAITGAERKAAQHKLLWDWLAFHRPAVVEGHLALRFPLLLTPPGILPYEISTPDDLSIERKPG